MRHTLFKILALFFMAYSGAQNIDISGNVQDGSGFPIPGANIIVNNSTKGTTTDFDGNFVLSGVKNGATISVSYIGYITQELVITSNKSLTIQLKEDLAQLDEVVVVGYGTQKVTKVSGAISTVKAETIENLKPTRVEEALQGSASGVSVIQSGAPGSKPTVLVRGIPSFTGGDPVVIIDGVPQSLDDLNAINSGDIQSLNILKDAASTAIYGVKGGNGVIVVTTKGGRKNQKTEFNYNTYTGTQSVIRKLGLLNATEYAVMANEGSVVAGGDLIFSDISSLGEGTDWQDEVFKNASLTSHSI